MDKVKDKGVIYFVIALWSIAIAAPIAIIDYEVDSDGLFRTDLSEAAKGLIPACASCCPRPVPTCLDMPHEPIPDMDSMQDMCMPCFGDAFNPNPCCGPSLCNTATGCCAGCGGIVATKP